MPQDTIRTFDQLPRDAYARPAILIVDDDPEWRALARGLLENALADEPVVILDSESVPGALDTLSTHLIHAVVLDKHLGPDSEDPQQNGVASVPRLLAVQDHLQIVMATSSDDIRDVVEAMRNGACDYIVKHKSAELFVEKVRKALRDGLREFRMKSDAKQSSTSEGVDLCGSSPAIQLLSQRISEMAKADAPVLLLGETGTGKTTAARLLHKLRGQYLKQPGRLFIHQNMAAIPESLAESMLFGNEAGAFTDAKTQKIGILEQARGGTLFLDEIGETSLAIQAKLLTAIEDGRFKRVGGSETVQSNFRLVCATNKNLEQLVRERKFREDLYRRISVIEIKVPSLSDRREDMESIVAAVLPKSCAYARVYVELDDIPKDFIESLAANPPAGNIRGVEQQLVRLFLYAPRDKKGRPILKQWRYIDGLNTRPAYILRLPTRALTFDELLSKPIDAISHPDFPGIQSFLEALEKKLYEDAQRKFGKSYGTNRLVARALGVSDTAVGVRLRQFGLATRLTKRKSEKEVELA